MYVSGSISQIYHTSAGITPPTGSDISEQYIKQPLNKSYLLTYPPQLRGGFIIT